MLTGKRGERETEREREKSVWQQEIKLELGGNLNDPLWHVKRFSADSLHSANTHREELSIHTYSTKPILATRKHSGSHRSTLSFIIVWIMRSTGLLQCVSLLEVGLKACRAAVIFPRVWLYTPNRVKILRTFHPSPSLHLYVKIGELSAAVLSSEAQECAFLPVRVKCI